jgi:AraC-like DNA-binding protein
MPECGVPRATKFAARPGRRLRTLFPVLGLVERAWSTEGHAEGSQFLVWSQIVSDAFGRLSLERPFEDDGASFRSACAGRRVGDLVLSSMSSQRQSVRRDEALIAGSPLGCYFVNVPLSGSGAVSQGGRTVTLGHGDVVVLDGDQPFRLEFARPFDEICMTIPKALLDPLLADPATCTARRIPGDRGVGAVVSSSLQELARDGHPLDRREMHAMSEHLVGLIALVLADAVVRLPSSARLLHLQAVLDEIERGYPDPALTAAEVARRVAVPAHLVGELLADRETTFEEWVLARRLEHAWALLDPELDDPRTVADVARDSGFADVDHFAMHFRKRFGMTPKERRCAV